MKRSFIIAKAMLFILIINFQVFGQDGEGLFKSKCNACHLLDKASTGPLLKGVKQKWTDAGEGDMLVEWVKNSTALIASGKSKMANEIKGYSAMDMPAQEVTKEDVDAILNYVDNPPAVVETPPTTGTEVTTAEPVVELLPNYEENLSKFYWLLVSMVILLVGILIMSSSVLNLAKSDFFKKRLAAKEKEENGNNTTLIAILVLVGMTLFSNQSLALSFVSPGQTTENTPWLLVENSDLYFMVVIDIILLGIIFYLKNMFKNLMNLVRTEKEKQIIAEEPKAITKINHVLTDAVPVEEEESILMKHEYDGIRELDNNLPPWWVWMFYATIVFAVVYLFHYHVLKTGDLQYQAYDKEIKQADKEVKAYLEANAMNVDENSVTLLTDGGEVAKGKAIFEANCVACHNPKGEGNIGPNLTDKTWIYGYDIKDVFKTIKTGTPNGMPEHGSKFNPVQIQEVASFVLSLPETAGKAAQGTIIEK